jgi:ribosomal-protein-alanine N-acetyltransferase
VSVSPNGSAQFTLRYMRLDDISQVVSVDASSFPSPWSPASYAFEIANNSTSHMIVLEMQRQASPGWRRVWQRLGGQPEPLVIVGYAGMWNIGGEAHISTIAVHPEWRRQGLGEALLNGLLTRAAALNSEYSVLEVRVSNQSAQALYRKYGYEIVGDRKGYYRDNNEDAYLMHLPELDAVYLERLHVLTDALRNRVTFTDRLAVTDSHPAPPPLPV